MKQVISEASFQRTLIDLLHIYHFQVCEFRKARIMKGGVDTYRTPFGADGVGFPDLVAVKGKRLLIIELKSEKGKLSEKQGNWLEALGRAGCEVYVWRPSDWEEIEAVVKGLTR